MNGQLEPTCEGCGDEVEPSEDVGVGGGHWHDNDQCKQQVHDEHRRKFIQQVRRKTA